MKLLAEFNHENYQITFEQNGENLTAEIDGRRYELEASQPEPNVYLLKHNGRIYEFFVSPNEKSNEPFQVSIGNHNLEIKILDPKRLRGKGAAAGQTDGAAEIKTAMPGKLVRVLVEKGAAVQKGDGILVVEAMKMQNEMKAPKDGVVKEIRFKEGATVNAGDVLAIIE
ncbi:MAG: biotin/lipoyl-binding protein [Acidobacteriota bacterium]|jgi:biotin carboxyl carrier protein|nr:biotin/lipoyl-binding protein [Acidobacteriota bacterium]